MHVILSVKILRSYYLNDKNLTKAKGQEEIDKGFVGHMVFEFLICRIEEPHPPFIFLHIEDHIEVPSNKNGGFKVMINKPVKILDKLNFETGGLKPISIDEMSFNSSAKYMKDNR